MKVIAKSTLFLLLLISLVSCTQEKNITINFETNGGTEIPSITFEEGTTFVMPHNPTKEGYTFVDWFIDNDTFLIPFAMALFDSEDLTNELTLYAKWEVVEETIEIEYYTVTFNSNGGESYDSLSVQENHTITLPTPSIEGHTFIGWFTGIGVDEVEFLETTSVITDLILNAKWEINSYEIVFETNGGSLVESIIEEFMTEIDEPAEPTKLGYTFDGWFMDEELLAPYEFLTMPSANVVVYAKWEINSYEIVFETNGGSLVESIIEEFMTEIDEPAEPTKLGYTFDGWFTDLELTQPYSFLSMPAEDITLYANWLINQYSIYYLTIDEDYIDPSIFLLPDETIIESDLGGFHSAIITSFGRVFTWGDNFRGYLGDGTTIDKSSPVEITHYFNLGQNESITSISLGYYNSAAISSSGRLFTWGSNLEGYTGDGTSINKLYPNDITPLFNLNVDEKIIEVSIGYWHSLVVTSSGRIFSWGANHNGQIGDGTTLQRRTPVEITQNFTLNPLEYMVAVSAGGSHSVALTNMGRVFTWGYNGEGRLGDGSVTSRSLPNEITNKFSLSPGEVISSIYLGLNHSSALSSLGRMFTWGDNLERQLGDGSDTYKRTPTNITSHFNLNPDEVITRISISQYHSSAITSLGRMFTWGGNTNGFIGNGTTQYSDIPVDITSFFNLDEGELIVHQSLGHQHSSAVTSHGRIFTWGSNFEGGLGDGTLTNRLIPTEIYNQSYSIVFIETYDYLANLSEYIPTREGYQFSGWFLNIELTHPQGLTSMPWFNITFYGYWIPNS